MLNFTEEANLRAPLAPCRGFLLFRLPAFFLNAFLVLYLAIIVVCMRGSSCFSVACLTDKTPTDS